MDKNQIAVSTYNKIARRYTELIFDDKSDLPYVDKFFAHLLKNAKILDAGCGPGQLLKYILSKGYEAEGVDLSEEMIKTANEKVPEGKFMLMDMRRLSYPDELFDGVISAYSLIHIPSAEVPDTLKEFNRVLKPHGFLLIMAQKGDADKIVSEPLDENEKIFINFFTREKLLTLLNEEGFEIVEQAEVQMAYAGAFTKSDTIIYTIAEKISKT